MPTVKLGKVEVNVTPAELSLLDQFDAARKRGAVLRSHLKAMDAWLNATESYTDEQTIALADSLQKEHGEGADTLRDAKSAAHAVQQVADRLLERVREHHSIGRTADIDVDREAAIFPAHCLKQCAALRALASKVMAKADLVREAIEAEAAAIREEAV